VEDEQVVKRILNLKVMPWISLIIGLMLTLFILALVILNTDFFAHAIGGMFSRYLFHGTSFSLSIEKLSGNPLKELRLLNFRIRYRGKDFSFDVVRVNEIYCKFGIFSMLKKEPFIDELVLENPHVWIKSDSSGVSILPFGAGGAGGGFPDFTIKRFTVRDGQVILQGDRKANAVRNITITGALRSSARELLIEITEGTAESLEEEMILRRLQGTIRWVGDRTLFERDVGVKNRLFLDDVTIELDESLLTMSGTVDPDSASFSLKVKVEPLEVEEIARLLDIETDHFGELQGTFIIRGCPDSVKVGGIVNGVFSGYALSGFTIDLLKDDANIRMNRLTGVLNGSYVDGRGLYTFAQPEVLDLDLDVQNLNLADGFIPGRDMPQTALNGDVKLVYYPTNGHLHFSCDLHEGHFRDFPFEQAIFRGAYREDSLSFDNILMTHPLHRISSRGSFVDGEKVTFYVDLECDREDTLFSYFGIEQYRADLGINGIWEGTLDAWELRASGTCSNFAYRNAFVPIGGMKLAIIFDESYQVYFDLDADSCVIDPLEFSGLELSLEYANGVTSIKNLHLASEKLDTGMRVDIDSGDQATEISFLNISLHALEESWLGSGKSRIIIRGSELQFDDFQLHSRLGALYLAGRMNRDENTITGRLSFERLGLSLFNQENIISTPVDGKGEGVITCDGSLSDPDIRIDLRVVDGHFDTLSVDSLSLTAHYSGGRYMVDSLLVSAPKGHFLVNGEIAGAPLKDLYNDSKQALRKATSRLDLYCRGLHLDPILGLHERVPFTTGMFTGTGLISGSLVHPTLTVEGVVENLTSPSMMVPSIDLGAKIGQGSVEIDGTVDVLSGQKGVFEGSIPILREEWFYSVDDNRPILLEFDLPEGDFGGFTRVTDFIAEGNGRFSANIKVSGTVNRPAILGELRLHNASFRLSGMEENYYEVNSKILLEDTLITVAEVRGREGKDGKFGCRGSIVLRGWKPKEYNLNVDLEDFVLASIPDLVAVLSGRLDINTEVEGERIIPVLSGNIEVKSAEIYYDLGDLATREQGGTMEPPSYIATIDLDVPGNTWIRTPDAKLELRGKVTLHHDWKGTYLRGELNLLRGWYNVYNNKFRIQSGKLEFAHAGSFRPIVDIEAETRDPEGRKIYLTLEWHQDDVEPRLSLRHEDPGYSETDIWKMLGGGIVGSPDSEGATWDARTTAQSLAANYIERMLNMQMEGVTIELESAGMTGTAGGAFEETETMIAIGKYLSEGLYVKYKQGLSISTARQIEVEYRISNLFLIRSEIIKYSEKLLQGKSPRSTDEINIDIKLRWEF